MTTQAPSAPDLPTLSVVIVTYDNEDHIGVCLESLLPQMPADGSTVVVYDNDSSDDTADVVARGFPGVRLIRADRNVGFARACNEAGTVAPGRYLLLLNPDTVVEPGCIDVLLDLARRRPDAGLYGGRTFAADGSFDPKSCWGRPTLWGMFCFASGLSSVFANSELFNGEGIGGWRRDSERHVDIVSGCLLLAWRDLWEQLGGFDERFFLYGEDADLGVRAAALGFRPMITPAARLVHHAGGSSEFMPRYVMLFRGKATVVHKMWVGPRGRLATGLLLAGVWLRTHLGAISGNVLPADDEGGPRVTARTWSELWRLRREWIGGWGDPTGDPTCATLEQ